MKKTKKTRRTNADHPIDDLHALIEDFGSICKQGLSEYYSFHIEEVIRQTRSYLAASTLIGAYEFDDFLERCLLNEGGNYSYLSSKLSDLSKVKERLVTVIATMESMNYFENRNRYFKH